MMAFRSQLTMMDEAPIGYTSGVTCKTSRDEKLAKIHGILDNFSGTLKD